MNVFKLSNILTAITLLFLLWAVNCRDKPEITRLNDSGENDWIARINDNRGKPAKFSRITSDTLLMEGGIQKGTHEEFLKNIDDEVRVLVLNSTGGCTNEGVKIGLDIIDRDITVIVEGMAGSSAANYIFLAGKRKIIKKGFVAFHGNSTALVESSGWENIRIQLYEETSEIFEQTGQDFEQFFRDYRKIVEETITLEEIFLRKINLSQDFFDLTQTASMGLSPELDYSFDFFIPSPDTFKKWGIENIEGSSDIQAAEKLGIKAIYY